MVLPTPVASHQASSDHHSHASRAVGRARRRRSSSQGLPPTRPPGLSCGACGMPVFTTHLAGVKTTISFAVRYYLLWHLRAPPGCIVFRQLQAAAGTLPWVKGVSARLGYLNLCTWSILAHRRSGFLSCVPFLPGIFDHVTKAVLLGVHVRYAGDLHRWCGTALALP